MARFAGAERGHAARQTLERRGNQRTGLVKTNRGHLRFISSSSLQTSVGRQSEHEAPCPRHHKLGSPITTYESETGAEVYQRQDRRLPAVCGYRLHRDVKSVSERLIAIVQPQLRCDLSRAQLKANLPCAFIHI
jgi:hypothetical protein